MALIQLIYVSAAIDELPEAELERILESSVSHNKPQGVTGMLIYLDGSFMQALEGEATTVDETFARIKKDTRHHSIIELSRHEINEREFASWLMGYRRLQKEDLKSHPEFKPITLWGIDAVRNEQHPGLAKSLLNQFSTGR